MSYRLIRPLMFSLEAERAHDLAIAAMARMPRSFGRPAPRLPVEIAGLTLPNPVGLAAGLDKEARAYNGFLRMGFGSVEVGTLTPLPQPGNPRPRLFRLVEDRAIINRMGFNSGGQQAALPRLEGPRDGIVGVNIGANKESADRIADYVAGVRAMIGVADYITMNISSPNTQGLRGLQEAEPVEALLSATLGARGEAKVPLFLKVAPDLTPDGIEAIARIALRHRIDAIVIGNTTIGRDGLQSPLAVETGGLSGAPLKALALQRLIDFRRATGGRIALIGVGGIETAEDAYARIRAGATCVQVYTAMIYQGPALARTIVTGLRKLLAQDGFASVAEAIGVDVPVGS